MWAYVGVPLLGVLAAIAGFDGPGRWPQDARYVAVGAAVLISVFYRFWRMGVRFDNHGVRIRGFLKTARFGWPEVSRFADGRTTVGVGGEKFSDFWALVVVLHDGRAITVKATAELGGFRGFLKGPECVLQDVSPKVLIEQVAARYQIPAELTGVMPPNSLPSPRWYP